MGRGKHLLLVTLLLSALAAGCLRTYEEPHYLRIVNLDLSPSKVLAQDVILNVTTILDNRGGGASGTVRLQAKAYSEDTGFLVAENETTVGTLAPDTTSSFSQLLKVPRVGSVRIDVALYEEERGDQRASISARNLASLEPEVLDTGLRISDLDFLVRSVGEAPALGGNNTTQATAPRPTIQTDMYITNEGVQPSESLRVQVKAREISTALVADIVWTETGSVAPGATVIRSVNLTVPDGYNYVFEILTWRGDAVVARNEGTVQLAPTFVKPKDQEMVVGNPNIGDFYRPTTTTMPTATYPGYYPAPGDSSTAPTPKVPGFEAAALVAALAAAMAILVLRRRRSP